MARGSIGIFAVVALAACGNGTTSTGDVQAVDARVDSDLVDSGSRDAGLDVRVTETGSSDASIDGGGEETGVDVVPADTGSDARVDTGAVDSGLGDSGSDSGSASLCPGTTPIAEPAEQVYVAPGGSDSAAGTASAPFATLGAAARHFPMGGTVIVRGGTYGQQSFAARGTAGHPLFIRAAAGETPIFDGGAISGTWPAVINLSAAQHVVFQGLEIANCRVNHCTSIQALPATDLAIVDCHLHNIDGSAARVSGSTILFEGNHIHDVAMANVDNVAFPTGGWPTCFGTSPNQTTPTTPQTDGVVIRNNVIENCWGEGVGVWYANNAVIDGNVIDNPFSVGIYMDNSSNVTVSRNFVRVVRGRSGSHGTGIEMATEHYSSMTLYPTTDVTITNNIVVGGTGIWWWKSPETTNVNTYQRVNVTHNTAIATSGPAFAFQAVNAGTPTPAGCVARNNVFAETSAASLGNASGWTLTSNAWIGSRPGIAGATDVAVMATVGTVTMATDVEPLVSVVGNGASGTGVAIDYACNPRSATAPRRGAYEF